jgi:protein-tyrosine phosphatase
VPGEDHERFDLKRYFEKSNDFIKSTREETNILVHCMAGISRSVTLVLAYLMKHCKMSFEEAFDTVKKKRKIVCMLLFRSTLTEVSSVNYRNSSELSKPKPKPCAEAVTRSKIAQR